MLPTLKNFKSDFCRLSERETGHIASHDHKKTDRKAKCYFNCKMKVDTSVRTFDETRDNLASVIFDTRNFKRVNQFVSRDIEVVS